MKVYHMLLSSEGVVDHTLYSLNELGRHHPSIAEAKRRKYNGREETLVRLIPHLNCLWGDVIFLSPAHPNLICAALASCMEKEIPSVPYYEIPIESLPHRQMAYWHFRSRVYDPCEVEPFDRKKYREVQAIPQATIEYYAEQKRSGERPLWCCHIPHVFLQGTIDVRRMRLLHTEIQKPKHVR